MKSEALTHIKIWANAYVVILADWCIERYLGHSIAVYA